MSILTLQVTKYLLNKIPLLDRCIPVYVSSDIYYNMSKNVQHSTLHSLRELLNPLSVVNESKWKNITNQIIEHMII